jgi:hypothetical protein
MTAPSPSSVRRLLRVALLVLAAAAGPACARRVVVADPDAPPAEAARRSVEVRIENRSWTDMTVYVTRSVGVPIRLGYVPGGQTITYDVPPLALTLAGTLRFVGEVGGGVRQRMPWREELPAQPGDRLTVVIPP